MQQAEQRRHEAEMQELQDAVNTMRASVEAAEVRHKRELSQAQHELAALEAVAGAARAEAQEARHRASRMELQAWPTSAPASLNDLPLLQ